jgi:hypothetical protein
VRVSASWADAAAMREIAAIKAAQAAGIVRNSFMMVRFQ